MSDQLERLKAALANRYEIEREVGAGGMATVYLAQDIRHERQVALKVLRPDLAASLGPDRFLQEVRVTANLQHPHILPLFDSGEADGFLYYVMPFIEGESLRDRLVRERELPVPDAARVLRNVVDALAAAHRAGVVHRDIKPENILITGRHAMVADFGVAKAVTEATGRHELTTMGVALGTPSYMAPEQAAADTNIDHRADIYAVGAMGYELLTGRPPFSGASPQEVLTAHVTKVPAPVTEHRASVPPALETLIMRCLEKKPADRWQRAEEMLPHLEAAATPSGGMTPTGLQPVSTGADPARRRPLGWALGVVAVVAVIFGAVWAFGDRGLGREAPVERGPLAAGASETPRVMVLPLENRTGDPEAEIWGTLVSEAATRLLARVAPDLDVMASGAVGEVVTALGGPGAASAEEAGRAANAAYVVAGSYARLGGSLRFDVEITETAGELVLALDPISGSESEPDSTVALAGEIIAVGAAYRLRPSMIVAGTEGTSPPRSVEVLDLYEEGQNAFCRRDYDRSLALQERSIELEPAFLPPYFGGMASYGNGGRSQMTSAQLRTMVEGRSGTMTATERAWYEWMTGSPDMMVRAARNMSRQVATFGYGLALAGVRANDLEAAADGVAAMVFDNPCWSDWNATWTMPVSVHHLLGNAAAELEAAQRGRERFPESGVFPLGEARAHMLRGDLDQAESMVAEIQGLPAAASAVASTLHRLGKELEVHGHPAVAARVYQQAWEWVQARPGAGLVARATAAYRALPPDEALPHLEEAVDSFPNSSDVTGPTAITLDRLGRTDEAQAVALGIYELSATSAWPSLFYAQRGDAASAVDHLRRILDAGRLYNNVGNLFLHHAPELLPIEDDPAFQALMRPKTGG